MLLFVVTPVVAVAWAFGIANATSDSEYSFGGAVQARAGIYEACWCRGACAHAAGFSVGIGHLTVIGPYEETYSCVLGEVCSLEMLGVDLGMGDMVAIMDTCGPGVLTHSKLATIRRAWMTMPWRILARWV